MENPTRRLCRFEYPCGLCGDEHRSEVYITLNAPNWDDYCDQVEGMTRDPDTLGEIIDRATLAFHQQKGDLERLMRKAKRDGFYKVGHTADVSVIDESEYTCDTCGATFETIHLLRAHVPHGRGPRARG